MYEYKISANVILGDIMYYKHMNINLLFDEMIEDVEFIKRKVMLSKIKK